MILKIEHGYVHLSKSKPGGIFRISDFDDEELRDQKSILFSRVRIGTEAEIKTYQETIVSINEELDRRTNIEAERR